MIFLSHNLNLLNFWFQNFNLGTFLWQKINFGIYFKIRKLFPRKNFLPGKKFLFLPLWGTWEDGNILLWHQRITVTFDTNMEPLVLMILILNLKFSIIKVIHLTRITLAHLQCHSNIFTAKRFPKKNLATSDILRSAKVRQCPEWINIFPPRGCWEGIRL